MVDVRVIASTNRNLEEEIRKGHFRKYLFYRFNVFPIDIPPLRERREDIPLLAKFYLQRFASAYRKDITMIPETVLKTLEDHDWPGNVRELINVVERAVILNDGPDLRLFEQLDGPAGPEPVRVESTEGRIAEAATGLEEMERSHILKALVECSWRIEGPRGAAARLRMNPSTLRSRMKKLGVRVARR